MAKQAASPPPTFGQQLGLLYAQWTTWCVVPIAHAVALDFSDRPDFYNDVPPNTAAKLTDLQANYSYQANFPDMAISLRLMKPIFGESDGHGSGNDGSAFQTFRLPVLAAAAAFAENTQPTGFPMLRRRVQSEIVPFKAQLTKLQDHSTKLQGASLSQTEKRIEFIFGIAQSILLDPAVDGVFAIHGNIDPAWPVELGSASDPLGGQLIQEITSQLPDLPYGVISREMFVHIQQIAKDGFLSISDIVDKNVEDANFDIGQLDQVIAELYAWDSDLRLMGVVPTPVLLPTPQPMPLPPRMQPAATVVATPTPAQLRAQAAVPAAAMLARPTLARPMTVYNSR
jgi:hypothetical protein